MRFQAAPDGSATQRTALNVKEPLDFVGCDWYQEARRDQQSDRYGRSGGVPMSHQSERYSLMTSPRSPGWL